MYESGPRTNENDSCREVQSGQGGSPACVRMASFFSTKNVRYTWRCSQLVSVIVRIKCVRYSPTMEKSIFQHYAVQLWVCLKKICFRNVRNVKKTFNEECVHEHMFLFALASFLLVEVAWKTRRDQDHQAQRLTNFVEHSERYRSRGSSCFCEAVRGNATHLRK